MRVLRDFLCLVAMTVVSGARAEDACAIKPFRWQEDCSELRTAGVLSGWDRIRYLPLNAEESMWLTLGGEYRFKSESLDAPDFDVRPSDRSYTAIDQRWLVHADLRTQIGIRAFVQLSAAADAGRRPGKRPFDASHPDLAQAFLDVPLPGPGATTLRLGRQEFNAGGNRLISTRDAANLRRGFDMAELENSLGDYSTAAFYGRPVQNRIGGFDDRADPGELFYGGWIARAWSNAATAPALNLFFFRRDRKTAFYEEGVASDRRRTIGLRLTGADKRFDYTAQIAVQNGSFGTAKIRALGFAGDMGWHLDGWGRPRIAMSFGYAGGDRRRGDGTLGTFDVIYPNLGYFTDAPVYYPGNTADVQPNVTVTLRSSLTLRAGTDVIYRVSKRDAVYAPPGIPLIVGNGSGPSFVAALDYLRADWIINPHVLVTLSGVHGSTGALVRRTGGRDLNYGSIAIDFRI